MSGLPPLKLTLEKAAVSGLATKSDLQTPAKPPTASKTNFSTESKLRIIAPDQDKPIDTIVRTKSKGGIKRSKRSKSKKNRRTRRR